MYWFAELHPLTNVCLGIGMITEPLTPEESYPNSSYVNIPSQDYSYVDKVYDKDTLTWREAHPQELKEHTTDRIAYKNEELWLSDKLDQMDIAIAAAGGGDTSNLVTQEQLSSAISEKADSAAVGTLSALATAEKSNLVGALNELFQDVSSGKNAVGGAISDRGVTVPTNPTFSQLATAIGQIPAGATIKTGKFADALNPASIVVNCGFKPRAVLLFNNSVTINKVNMFAFVGKALVDSASDYSINMYGKDGVFTRAYNIFTLSDTGFSVANAGSTDNMYWIAIA